MPASTYQLEQTNRIAVSVSHLYAIGYEEARWRYDDESAEFGLDPWKMIGGIDRHITDRNRYFIESSSGATSIDAGPDDMLYVQSKQWKKWHLENATSVLEVDPLKVPSEMDRSTLSELIARTLEPDAWDEYDKSADGKITNQSISKIHSSIMQTDAVMNLLFGKEKPSS